MKSFRFRKTLTYLYGPFAVLFLWQILFLLAKSEAVPSPYSVLINCFKVLHTTPLILHGAYSFVRLTFATLLAIIIGGALGISMGLKESVNKLLAPILYVFFPIPKVALLPVLFIFFGLGDLTKILLIFLILVFQVCFMVRDALKTIPQSLLLTAKSLSLDTFSMLKNVYLPSLSKILISALRLSVGTGIAVLFFAENYATSYGLGFFIMNSWSLINYLDMYSGIVYLSLLGALLFYIIDFVEKKYCGWYY